MFNIFGCPIHVGVGVKGLTYSLDYLKSHYKNLDIDVIPEVILPEEALPNLKNLNSVIATCNSIAMHQANVLKKGELPLLIAGDHSSVMGSVSASSVAYKNLGMIYVDAHPDINTDATTVSGNIHGMPVAALLGMGEEKLTKFLTEDVKLDAKNIVMIGLRDIDPPEAVFLEKLNIKYYTYDMVVAKGLDECLAESVAYLSHLDAVHISFDIDSMNPELMPGVSVPVKSGLTIEETYTLFDTFLSELPIVSLDIVEFNVDYDIDNKTSDFVSDLVSFITTHKKYQ
ncbi:MAG: arginase [Lachnospiraceae bacterium]